MNTPESSKSETIYETFLRENRQRIDDLLDQQIPEYYMLREENNIESQLKSILRFRIEHDPDPARSNQAAVTYAALAAQREGFDCDYIFEIILQRHLFEDVLKRAKELEEGESDDEDLDYILLDYYLRCLKIVYSRDEKI